MNEPSKPAPSTFLILGSERTGSNLLVGLIDSHPDAIVGEELFNKSCLENGNIPFPGLGKDEELIALRQQDQGRFLDRLYERVAERGCAVLGYKIFYRQFDRWTTALQHLAGKPDLKVIHLRRRNLLRQLVSYQQAVITGQWKRRPGVERAPPPPVELDLAQCVRTFLQIEDWARRYDEAFADHAKMTIWYEDMAVDPDGTAKACHEFLGLEPMPSGPLRYKKSGQSSVRDSIVNYDAVREGFARWLGFFES
ncbi:MAG: Stf0 family sulfotransferase [Planctomycetota bacterium]